MSRSAEHEQQQKYLFEQLTATLRRAELQQEEQQKQSQHFFRQVQIYDVRRQIEDFWPKQMERVEQMTQNELREATKTQELPLARIKKIMKLDEDVKNQMISAEVPILFAKAGEMFIEQLTLMAWSHTEDYKRKTLQKSDISMAVGKDEMFDFLIDFVPREESTAGAASSTLNSGNNNAWYKSRVRTQGQQQNFQGQVLQIVDTNTLLSLQQQQQQNSLDDSAIQYVLSSGRNGEEEEEDEDEEEETANQQQHVIHIDQQQLAEIMRAANQTSASAAPANEQQAYYIQLPTGGASSHQQHQQVIMSTGDVVTPITLPNGQVVQATQIGQPIPIQAAQGGQNFQLITVGGQEQNMQIQLLSTPNLNSDTTVGNVGRN